MSPGQLRVSWDEVDLFHYFRTEVADEIAGAFDENFWKVHLLRAVQTQPVLWYATNAVAAIHRRHRSRGLTASDARLQVHALQRYNASVQHIMRLTKQPNLKRADKEDIILATFLFMVLAWLRGDIPECFLHYTNGGNLLGQWKLYDQLILFRKTDRDKLLPIDSIFSMYWRADSMMMNMRAASFPNQDPFPGLKLPLRNEPFVSITDAYFEMEVIWNITTDTIFVSKDVDVGLRQRIGASQKNRLGKWGEKFQQLMSSKQHRSESEAAAITALEIRVAILNIAVNLDITEFETCWDLFDDDFGKALLLAEDLTAQLTIPKSILAGKAYREGRTLTFTPLLNESLHIIARHCRNPILRRRAVALLEFDFNRSAAIDTALYICMAIEVIEIEEKVWKRYPKEGTEAPCGCITGAFICNSHRVRDTSVLYPSEGMAELIAVTMDDFDRGNPGQKVSMAYGMYRGDGGECEVGCHQSTNQLLIQGNEPCGE